MKNTKNNTNPQNSLDVEDATSEPQCGALKNELGTLSNKELAALQTKALRQGDFESLRAINEEASFRWSIMAVEMPEWTPMVAR